MFSVIAAMLALRLPSSATMREPLRPVCADSDILGDSDGHNASSKKMETSRGTQDAKLGKCRSFDQAGR